MITDMRRMIGEILVEMGSASQENIDRALEKQMNGDHRKLGEILVAEGTCAIDDITAALAEQYQMEMVDIAVLDIPPDVVQVVPEDLAREHRLMPIEMSEGVLVVAISDPLDIYALDNLRFVISAQVEPVLATPAAIETALNKYYGLREEDINRMMQDLSETEIDFIQTGEADAAGATQDDAPVIRLVHLMIMEAVRQRASDVHVEPMMDRVRVRYRIDGVCYEVDSPPKRLQGPIIARIKIMAKMDMAEKRRPQDGRIMLQMLGRKLDLRVSSLPATHGESVVMRLLDKESVKFGLEYLGFHSEDLKVFHNLIRKPNGIILITGPTGSGKTTTLYAALNELNQPDRKIITAENPVEYMIAGINQCDMKPDIGFTFQRALRSMLRQAPNVILVGEIRDHETAEIAIQAALTGHLVFSTLHTNDAPTALTRLVDMGVPPFLVASSIQAVMAQRLVRTICNNCKQPYQEDLPRLKAVGLRDDQIQEHTFYRGVGCEVCNNLGFKGRKGIFELMVMNNRLRELAFNRATTDEIREQARRDGMHMLLEDGLRKILAGLTTLDEVLAEAKVIT